MRLVVLSGTANVPLARAIADRLGVEPARRSVESFPDGELGVELLDSMRGADAYVVQPTGPPVAENLLELLLLADACRRSGVARLTAVVSYFGYARQDRRARGREAIGARLVGDLVGRAGYERIVAVDLHDPALEGFFSIPVEHLTATPILCDAVRERLPDDPVIVAPDLGATKLAERFAERLGAPVAIVHKSRSSGSEVRVRRIIGEVAGRTPVVVDDMISTAGTLDAAVRALVQAGCRTPVLLAATHALLVGNAVERLAALPVRELIVTDTLAVAKTDRLPLRTVSVAALLATAIDRLCHDRSLDDLLLHA